MSVIAANMLILNPNRVLPAAGSKLSVLKHSFAQVILVTLLQHRAVFFNKNLQLHLHLKPSLNCSFIYMACSYFLGKKFEPRSYKIVLIKKEREYVVKRNLRICYFI